MNLEELRAFVRTLVGDINQCIAALNEDSDPDFWSRAYLHSYGAFIEGVVVTYKAFLQYFHQGGYFALSEEQKLFISGNDWRIDGTHIRVFEKRISTKDALKALLHMAGEVIPNYKPDFGSKGWNEVINFYRVRDSVTHPKSLNCLSVPLSTVKALDAGRQWLVDEVLNINQRTVEMMDAHGPRA